jgi:two-component system sensor histidine kinase VicK
VYQADYNLIIQASKLTGSGVAIYNLKKQRFEYTNESFHTIFETTKEQLDDKGEFLLKLIHSEDIDYLRNRYDELLQKGFLETTEFRLHFAWERIKYIRAFMLVLESGNLIASIIADISQPKLHEDYLINYSIRKDAMLDMLTHNLSGPLQLSKDIIASIKQGLCDEKSVEMKKLISIMQENTQQCIDIVDDFLREEYVESTHVYVKKSRFDAIERLRVLIEKLGEINKDKKFVLHTSLHSLSISSDPVKFFQILHNVLSNAIKFTEADSEIVVQVHELDGNFQVSVKDTGVGIPEHLKPLLFKGRVAGRTGLKGERSFGMGLSITSQLVELMKGKIWFESEQDKGSTFFIQLPKE